MIQIKTYDDFIQARKKTDEPIWKVRHSAGSTNKINEIMKGYVLAPDFDKKRLLAYRVNYNDDTEYLFVKWLLKNTLAQYKKKSDKLNFVEDCLRNFGENNLQYYDSQRPVARFTGNDKNIFSLERYYPEYLVSMLGEAFAGDSWRPYFKSLDVQIVWALLDHNKEIDLKTGQRFDGDNPLHRKLAAIAMQIEKQTNGRLFKGITARWEQDTGTTQKARLEKSQDKAIRGHRRDASEDEVEILKKIKSGKKVPVETILGLSEGSFQQIMPSDLAELDVSDIYKIYTDGQYKATDTQGRAILELLVKLAPVDRNWYKTLSMYLTRFRYRSDYKLLNVFDKRFAKVAKGIKQELKECEAEKEAQQKEYDGIRSNQAKVAKEIKELEQTRDIYFNAVKINNGLLSEFIKLTKSGSQAEREFYSKYYTKLSNYYNLFISGKTKNYAFDVTEITGHPWKLLGNREEKQHLDTAKRIFNSLLDSCKNPPAPWTAKEDKKLRELEQQAWSLNGDEASSSANLSRLRDQHDDLLRDEDSVARFSVVMENARKEHLKKIETATQAFVKKYGRQPRKTGLTDVREK